MLTKELVFEAYHRNMVVYDNNQQTGIIGPNLITLLQDADFRNYVTRTKGKVTSIVDVYLPKYVESQIETNIWGPVVLHFDEKMNYQGEWYKYYFDELKGTIPSQKREIMVVVNNYGVPLLGAF